MNEARRHAITASELLASTDRVAERIKNLTLDERMQMVVSGETSRLNADLAWTVDLAQAHALTAIALAHTDDEIEELGSDQMRLDDAAPEGF